MNLSELYIIKSRYGRYEDNAKNRRLHRVGQEYGAKAKEEEGTEKQAKTEERTFGRAKKELAAVLANKDAFISKYGEAKFNEKVGQLIGEAQQLNGAEKQAKMDGDFEALKQDKRSKKEIRTERLGRYKASLEKVKESLKDTSLSPASRKAGEAMQAKLEEKITKLEARIGGKRKAEEPKVDKEVAKDTEPVEKLVNELKEETNKKEFHIGSKITVDNAQDFANRINNGELHVVNTRGKNQLYVVVEASEPYYYNGKNKIQLTFKYIGSDKNNLDYPNGTDYDDFTIDELNTMVSNSSLSIANKNKGKEDARSNVKPEAGGEAKKNLAKKSPARIVADTLQKIKDRFGYEKNWTDEKTEKLQDILIENEKIVYSVMRAAFPSAASGSPMHPNTKEVDIDGKSFTFGAYSTMDTTSRNPSSREGITNHYFVKDDYGKTIAEYTSGGRWTTPADAKNNCKLYVLRTLLKF